MRVATVVGARPQFVKAAQLGRALSGAGHEETMVHTGQHYDEGMSAVFFQELGIPEPAENLGVGSGTHAWQLSQMMERLERFLVKREPDWVVVFGDTNSTLAGALTASCLKIPVAHVEAGLRSFDASMPEERNRVLTDHCSDLLLCPSEAAAANLSCEGLSGNVHVVGDVMADALEFARGRVRPGVLEGLGLTERGYLLVTIHRAENTDNATRLQTIVAALDGAGEPVVFPAHPRTRGALAALGYSPPAHVSLLEPLGHPDTVALAAGARMILTDSGGLQKEAYWLGIPCVTLRDVTEWTETVDAGWNTLSGADTERVLEAVRSFSPPVERPPLYGGAGAATMCVAAMEEAAPRALRPAREHA